VQRAIRETERSRQGFNNHFRGSFVSKSLTIFLAKKDILAMENGPAF